MPDRKPPGGESLYRGPARAPRDKRERERDRQTRTPREDGIRACREQGTGKTETPWPSSAGTGTTVFEFVAKMR